MKHILCVIPVLILLSFSAKSQNQEPILVLESAELTQENFKPIFLFCIENEEFEMDAACVPAHVICFKSKTGNPINEALLKSTMENIGGITFQVIPNCSIEEFSEKCSNARFGNQ